MMDTIRFPILRVLAVYWIITTLFGILNMDNVFAVNFGVGLGYLIFMLLIGGSNAVLLWSSVQGRLPDEVYLVFYGILHAFAAVGFLIMRLAIFPDMYSVVATSGVQVNLLILLFAFTAIMSLVKNEVLSVKHLFSRVPPADPKDDPTYIDVERWERLNQMGR